MTLPATNILTSDSLGDQDSIIIPAKSGNCGCDSSTTPEMDEKLRERIAKHPCYSEEAHHHYARMHVAVA
ncbi:MAG: nitrogenase cofactor biosynthesis protein NifB, partial [Dolichospermum sp.]